MKYLITFIAAFILLFVNGCGSERVYKKTFSKHYGANTLIGSWYTYSQRFTSNRLQIKETKKEEFFKNGQLISSKWFAIKDRTGRDLGEFYITKLFNWKMQGSRVVAKFNRCSVGVTRALKVKGVGYNRLKRACQNSLKRRGKVTIKRIKFINYNRIKLGNMIYQREK